ncbi:fimbrial protein [Klebsiella aerogenes]|uniref:fimbrial protein n=1 Tax=Klebsiella aerogenes TaxID=548 RepID=UPI002DBA3F70|nr:fimbrial protein [Klebsiella aerogenes]MEB5742667.1 fimbrial protein [Klebsiella aerogenes]
MKYGAIDFFKRIHLILFLAVLFGMSHLAQASCTVQNMATIPLQFNVTDTYSGNERPVGSTLYRATYSSGSFGNGATVTCDQDTTLYTYLTPMTEPSGSPVTMSTDFGTGPVYPTNVRGIGVLYFYHDGSPTFITQNSPARLSVYDVSANKPHKFDGSVEQFDVAVIKTGPIELSSSLSISQDFPKLAMVLSTKTTYDPSAMKVVDFPQSGSIVITAATCETQDLTVDMGDHDVNEFIIGKGFTTVWKDASIVLKNCPTFSGYYANHYTGQVFSPKGGRASEPRAGRNPNILTVSLSALEPLIDTANQVIGLESIDNAATGVGVQLGYSTNIDANPITPQNIWQSGKSWDISPPSDERHSFKIPLAARYYQVDNTVTPGVANAKIMFNIDYK